LKARRWYAAHKIKHLKPSPWSRQRSPEAPGHAQRSAKHAPSVSVAETVHQYSASLRSSPSSSSSGNGVRQSKISSASMSFGAPAVEATPALSREVWPRDATGLRRALTSTPVFPRVGSPIPSKGHRSPARAAHQTRRPATGTVQTASGTSPRGISPQGTSSAPCTVDVDAMLASLLSGNLLSTSPLLDTASPASPLFASDLQEVSAMLSAALPSVEILRVTRVQCTGTAVTAYEAVRDSLGPERLLWHGTSWDSVANIARHGFNRAYAYGSAQRHGSRLGRGCYFAEDPKFALRFCERSEGRKALFLAGVLPGCFTRGAIGLIEPPLADTHGARFDSTVDNEESPKVFCVFRDFQAVPLYFAEVA